MNSHRIEDSQRFCQSFSDWSVSFASLEASSPSCRDHRRNFSCLAGYYLNFCWIVVTEMSELEVRVVIVASLMEMEGDLRRSLEVVTVRDVCKNWIVDEVLRKRHQMTPEVWVILVLDERYRMVMTATVSASLIVTVACLSRFRLAIWWKLVDCQCSVTCGFWFRSERILWKFLMQFFNVDNFGVCSY